MEPEHHPQLWRGDPPGAACEDKHSDWGQSDPAAACGVKGTEQSPIVIPAEAVLTHPIGTEFECKTCVSGNMLFGC